MTTKYVHWGGAKVKLTWQRDKKLPPKSLITSVHGFCFKDNQLLLVNLNDRGWDFPGGRIEFQETPEECMKREAYEEGYISGRCFPLGFIVVDHNENPNWNEDSPYPKVGYQVFYRMDIERIHTFQAKYESNKRKFINTNEFKRYYHDWNELHQEILNFAINQT